MASRQTGNELQIDIRREPRERFGLRIFSSNVNPVTVVIGVTANGPAARCGLRIGDQVAETPCAVHFYCGERLRMSAAMLPKT
eukprot:m.75497 g.75497  ORF g.75497 m.75497 type:complete len:83 (+) comp10420_c0_seq1:210-458(+)